MFKKDDLFFEKLEQSIGYLYVIEESTYSLVYMSEAMQFFGQMTNRNNKCCFEILHGRSSPCPFCPQSVSEQKSMCLDGYISSKKKWFQYKMITYSPAEQKYRIVLMDEVENMMSLSCEAVGQISTYKNLYEDNIKIKKQLLYDASHDGMTGLYNKASYLRDVEQIGFLNQSFGIIVCDVNNLKYINDSVGHVAGDKIIRITARILKFAENDSTRCYRIGGDEFVILQTPCNAETIEKVAVDVEKRVKKYCDNKLSVAVGWAAGKPEDDFQTVFKFADKQMYKNKEDKKRIMGIL
ncbi:GGDEF domain-containing protein [Oscillospiraceae bacterium LTW-04]|nr:GGDEF domain-containing protein [Oscillospiraceae bacterium MB24-C1]